MAAVAMRPVGASVHLRKGTINRSLVGWMVLDSVAMAFLGYLLHLLGGATSAQLNIEKALGAAPLPVAALPGRRVGAHGRMSAPWTSWRLLT